MKTLAKLAALLLLPFAVPAPGAEAPPDVPADVLAVVPDGMRLLTFKTAGPRNDGFDKAGEGYIAAAVYETASDTDGVRYRTLTLFIRKDGRFVPELTNDKVIACSKCSQFHDDPFIPDHLEVITGHIAKILQMDGGMHSSTTELVFFRRNDGQWVVTKAERITYEYGLDDEVLKEQLPLPASGLVRDMDAHWIVPEYFSTLVVNQRRHRYTFLSGAHSLAQVGREIRAKVNDTRNDRRVCTVESHCEVAAQLHHDGCISVVESESLQLFGGSTQELKASKAIANAMAACSAAGGKACTALRTECNVGVETNTRALDE